MNFGSYDATNFDYLMGILFAIVILAFGSIGGVKVIKQKKR